MNSHFADQVVIVTGAGSGFGPRPDALAERAGQHPSSVSFPVDVTQDDAPEAVVHAALGRWGRIDVLVTNAGAFAAMPLEQATAPRIAQLLAVNVVAPSLLA